MPCVRIRKRYSKKIPYLDKILDNLEKKGRVITNGKDARYLGYIFKSHKDKIYFGGKGHIMLNPDYVMKRRNKKIIEIVRDVTTKP